MMKMKRWFATRSLQVAIVTGGFLLAMSYRSLATTDGTLMGTVVLEGGVSFAMYTRGDAYRAVLEGEQTPDGLHLRKVYTDRIVVEKGGRTREILLFSEGPRPLSSSAPSVRDSDAPSATAPGARLASLGARAENIRTQREQVQRRSRRVRTAPGVDDSGTAAAN